MDAYLASLPEWRDDQQIRSLFASFAQPRSVNPEAYDTRLQFWQRLLLECARRGYIGRSVFRLPEPAAVAEIFARKGSRPLGVAHVMAHLVQMDFARDERPAAAADSLLFRFARLAIARPISSGWRWISGADSEGDADDSENDPKVGSLILTLLIRETADAVLKLNAEERSSKHLSVMSYAEFTALVQRSRAKAGLAKVTDSRDFGLLLDYLRRKRLVSVLEGATEEELVIRVKLPEEALPKPISSEEANIVKMRTLLATLDGQLHLLSGQIEEARTNAKSALRAQDRQLALYELRRSKMIETARGQRLRASSTVQEILFKIDSAQSDSQIFEAYKAGEQALRHVFASTKMTVEDVDDVMVSLQEAISQQNELSMAIAAPIAISGDASEEELFEQELAELIRSPDQPEIVEFFPPVPVDEADKHAGAEADEHARAEADEHAKAENSPVPVSE